MDVCANPVDKMVIAGVRRVYIHVQRCTAYGLLGALVTHKKIASRNTFVLGARADLDRPRQYKISSLHRPPKANEEPEGGGHGFAPPPLTRGAARGLDFRKLLLRRMICLLSMLPILMLIRFSSSSKSSFFAIPRSPIELSNN